MYWFRITLQALEEIRFRRTEVTYKGGIFHGLVEDTVKRHSTSLFELLKDRSMQRHSRYAVRPPLGAQARYGRGEKIEFWLVLYGSSCDAWSELLAAFLVRPVLGIGSERGAMWVARIDSLDPDGTSRPILADGDSHFSGVPQGVITTEADWKESSGVALELLTPVTITSSTKRQLGFDRVRASPESQEVVPSERWVNSLLERWVSSLRERLIILEPDIARSFRFDTDEWVTQQDELKRCSVGLSQLRDFDWRWMSGTKSKPIMLHGLMGAVSYHAKLPPVVMALLTLGQWLGVGQRNTLGQGWYTLTRREEP